MVLDPNSLERLVPEHVHPGDITGRETLALHLARYEFAAKHVRPGRLLDIACGVGYGTCLLADQSQVKVTALGVDISEEAIAYAREHYGSDGVQFLVADAMQFRDADGFDTIISLETIEHMIDPEGFIAHLIRQLRPGGIFIGSVPTTPSVDANPHHLHDFTESSFRRIVQRYGLKEISCYRQVQPFNVIPVLTRKETRLRDLRRNLPLYYLARPGKLALRLWSTVRHGFNNKYITICWQAKV